MQVIRRRNARRIVHYYWNERTGVAIRSWEGEGGPPAVDAVFQDLCWFDWEQRKQMREKMRKEKAR